MSASAPAEANIFRIMVFPLISCYGLRTAQFGQSRNAWEALHHGECNVDAVLRRTSVDPRATLTGTMFGLHFKAPTVAFPKGASHVSIRLCIGVLWRRRARRR